jgi:hypothetical protein
MVNATPALANARTVGKAKDVKSKPAPTIATAEAHAITPTNLILYAIVKKDIWVSTVGLYLVNGTPSQMFLNLVAMKI